MCIKVDTGTTNSTLFFFSAVVKNNSSAGADVLVSFATLGKALGAFFWPSDKDVHTVSRRSVISTNITFEARAGGRSWCITNASEIQALYKKFQ